MELEKGNAKPQFMSWYVNCKCSGSAGQKNLSIGSSINVDSDLKSAGHRTMNIQFIPLADVKEVLRESFIHFQGHDWFRVAQSWTQEELELIETNSDGFGYLLIRIDPVTRKGLPREGEPTFH